MGVMVILDDRVVGIRGVGLDTHLADIVEKEVNVNTKGKQINVTSVTVAA